MLLKQKVRSRVKKVLETIRETRRFATYYSRRIYTHTDKREREREIKKMEQITTKNNKIYE